MAAPVQQAVKVQDAEEQKLCKEWLKWATSQKKRTMEQYLEKTKAKDGTWDLVKLAEVIEGINTWFAFQVVRASEAITEDRPWGGADNQSLTTISENRVEPLAVALARPKLTAEEASYTDPYHRILGGDHVRFVNRERITSDKKLTPYFDLTPYGDGLNTHPVKRVYISASHFQDLVDRTGGRKVALANRTDPFKMHKSNKKVKLTAVTKPVKKKKKVVKKGIKVVKKGMKK